MRLWKIGNIEEGKDISLESGLDRHGWKDGQRTTTCLKKTTRVRAGVGHFEVCSAFFSVQLDAHYHKVGDLRIAEDDHDIHRLDELLLNQERSIHFGHHETL